MNKVRPPTLGIYGKWDFIVHPNQAKVLQKGVPHAKTLMYPDAGHLPMMDTPDRLIRDIREFLLAK